MRIDDRGRTIVWTRCAHCGAELVFYPRPPGQEEIASWLDVACAQCGLTPRETGARGTQP